MKLKCKVNGKRAVIVGFDSSGVIAIVKMPSGFIMGHVDSAGNVTQYSQVELVDKYVLEFLEDYHSEFKE